MSTKIVFLFLLAFTFFQNKGIGDKYIVDTQILNIREYRDKDSDIIGQVKYGDTIISAGKFNSWIRFNIKNDIRIEKQPLNNYAYLHIDYLKLIKEEAETGAKPEPVTEKNKPFTYGFIKGMKYPLLIIFFILAFKDYVRNKRIKDSRFSKGYKEIPFSGLELMKYAFYAFIFSLPFGIISGFYYWFLNW